MSVRTPTDSIDGRTLKDLLIAVRNGFVVHRPVLVEIHADYRPGDSADRTMTVNKPIVSVEAQGREYAGHPIRCLGPNTLLTETDPPVSIGRSRKCIVRVDDDTVSKTHAAIGFDVAVGEYYLVDEYSSNGSTVDGQAAIPGVRMPLWSGAYVAFGGIVYAFLEPATLRILARLAK